MRIKIERYVTWNDMSHGRYATGTFEGMCGWSFLVWCLRRLQLCSAVRFASLSQ